MAKICVDAGKAGLPIFTANHAGGKWLYEVRQLVQDGTR
jgi:hypothetical protein